MDAEQLCGLSVAAGRMMKATRESQVCTDYRGTQAGGDAPGPQREARRRTHSRPQHPAHLIHLLTGSFCKSVQSACHAQS